MHSELIDRIYEAAVIPSKWSAVLDDLTMAGRGHFAALFTFSNSGAHWVASKDGVRISEDYVSEGWPQRTDRVQRLLALDRAGFVGDLDVYTREEMDREPVFTEFHRPRGLGWGVATAVPVPTGDMLIVDIERRFETGPVEPETVRTLDLLRPHLARAGLLSARLAFERAQAGVVALDLIGLPAAVLSHRQHVIAANSRLEQLMPQVVHDRNDRVSLADRAADGVFAEALARLRSPAIADGDGVGSIPISARDDHPPYIVHLVPTRAAANDVFSGASALMIVTPVVPTEVASANVLQGLFDLTPAEARVARHVAQQQTVQAIAGMLGVSHETVRSQLKAVLAKTGTSRQVELAALLAGCSVNF